MPAPPTPPEPAPARLAAARDAFDPARFGFRPHQAGWVKEVPGIGPVAFAPLSWPHAQAPSYDRVDHDPVAVDALGFLVGLQRRTWGLPPEDLVPANMLAVLPDTGGAVLVAYDLARGFNADGWLGFVIGAGARSGTLVSHMLGVRDEVRGTKDLGWALKILQAHEALRTGHHAVCWTFDPMRGINARLNIEKLGAVVPELTVDKYGVLRSTLYGEDVPTDRFTARWDLLAPATWERIAAVAAGRYQGPSPLDARPLPELTRKTAPHLRATRPPCLRYRIPGDIDALMRIDPHRAIAWRQELRALLTSFLTVKSARLTGPVAADPTAVGSDTRPGDYVVTGFATGLDDRGDRISAYLLDRLSGKAPS